MVKAIAWAVQLMVGILLRGPDPGSDACHGLHGSEADHCLLRAWLTHGFGHDTKQRTLSTAVGLHGRELDLYEVAFGHFFIFVFVVVSRYRDALASEGCHFARVRLRVMFG